MNEVLGRFVLRVNEYMFRPSNRPTNKRLVVAFVDNEDFFAGKLLKASLFALGPEWNLRLYHTKENADFIRSFTLGWAGIETRVMKFPSEEILTRASFWTSCQAYDDVLVFDRPALVYRPLPPSTRAFVGSADGGLALFKPVGALAACTVGAGTIHSRIAALSPCPPEEDVLKRALAVRDLAISSDEANTLLANVRW